MTCQKLGVAGPIQQKIKLPLPKKRKCFYKTQTDLKELIEKNLRIQHVQDFTEQNYSRCLQYIKQRVFRNYHIRICSVTTVLETTIDTYFS